MHPGRVPCRTFFTVVPLVARVTDAGAHDADAVPAAVDVHALVGRHVALGALPAAVALAAAARVLPVSAAQQGACSWGPWGGGHREGQGQIRGRGV